MTTPFVTAVFAGRSVTLSYKGESHTIERSGPIDTEWRAVVSDCIVTIIGNDIEAMSIDGEVLGIKVMKETEEPVEAYDQMRTLANRQLYKRPEKTFRS